MQVQVHVKLTPKDRLRPAVLSDDSGIPVVLLGGKPRGPGDVEAVYVLPGCPVALLDAAVEAGCYVLGVTGAKQ